jgi:hypothetical protein
MRSKPNSVRRTLVGRVCPQGGKPQPTTTTDDTDHTDKNTNGSSLSHPCLSAKSVVKNLRGSRELSSIVIQRAASLELWSHSAL